MTTDRRLHGFLLCAAIALLLPAFVCAAEEVVAVRFAPVEKMPLDLYGKPVGTRRPMHFDLPMATSAIQDAWLELGVDDIDEPKEAAIVLNGNARIEVQGTILGEGGGHFGRLSVPATSFRKGRNEIAFVFADDLNGTTAGYLITDASLVVVVPKSLAPKKGQVSVTQLQAQRIQAAAGLPLDLREAKVGATATLDFPIDGDPAAVREAVLEVLAADVNAPGELKILVNDRGELMVPKGIVGDRTGHLAHIAVDKKFLTKGTNRVKFVLADKNNGAWDGFAIDRAELILLRERDASGRVVGRGLVVNYDFTAGSLPGAGGLVRDLSGNGIDAQLRPARGKTRDVFGTKAKEGVDYRVVRRSGGLPDRVSELGMSGGAWMDVPLDDRIARIDQNGAVELIVRPAAKHGILHLLRVGSIAGGTLRHIGLAIVFDFRGNAEGQRLYSDMRAISTPPAYGVKVHAASVPQPAEPTTHQIVYCLHNGKGRFYHNGIPYTVQQCKGSQESGALFAWLVRKAGGKTRLRFGIGGGVHPGGVGSPFRGGIVAARIYDRPLSPDEMRTNYWATIGGRAPSPEKVQLYSNATAWKRPMVFLPRESRPIKKRTTPMVAATTIDFFDTVLMLKRPWTDADTKELVRHVHDAGFKVFYLRLGNGVTYWPSQVQDAYHRHTENKRHGAGAKALEVTCKSMNALESFVKWCHHYGLKAIYWQTLYDEEITLNRNAPGSAAAKKLGEYPMLSRFCREHPEMQWQHRDTWKAPNRGKQGRLPSGQRRYWGGCLCYLYPEARKYRIDMCRELVEKYNVDGVAYSHRSHSVFSGWQKQIDNYGFNEPVVAEYRKRYGVDIRTQAFDRKKWAAIRGEGLTQLVRETHAYLSSVGKEFHMMANPGPNSLVADFPYFVTARPMFFNKLDFAWQTWVNEGLIDCLILYGASPEGYPSAWVKEVANVAKTLKRAGVPAYFFYRLLGGGRVPLDACKTDVAQLWNDANLNGLIIYETDNLLPKGRPPDCYGGKLMPYLKEVFAGKVP